VLTDKQLNTPRASVRKARPPQPPAPLDGE